MEENGNQGESINQSPILMQQVNENKIEINPVDTNNLTETIETNNTEIDSEKKNVSKGVIVVLLLIVLAILCAIIFYVIVPRVINFREQNRGYNDLVTKSTSNVQNFYSTKILNNNQNIIASGDYTINSEYQMTLIPSGAYFDILVNNKKITTSKMVFPTIGFIDDLMLFVTQENIYRTTRLFAVDSTGNIVFDFYNVKSSEGLVLMPDASSFIYNTTSLVVMTSRVQEQSIILDNNFGAMAGISICDVDKLHEKSITDDSVVIGTYSIEYMGEHKFDIKRINGISLGQYKTQKNYCQ